MRAGEAEEGGLRALGARRTPFQSDTKSTDLRPKWAKNLQILTGNLGFPLPPAAPSRSAAMAALVWKD